MLVCLLLKVVGDVREAFDLANGSERQTFCEGVGDREAAHDSRAATLTVFTFCLDTLNFHLFSSYLLGVVPCLCVHYGFTVTRCQYLERHIFKGAGRCILITLSEVYSYQSVYMM